MRLAEDKMLALKTATKLLIHAVGGLEAAASACRVSVSVLSEYQSRNHPERMMPVDVALQLEAVAGEAVVTGAMARLQGLSLGRPAEGEVPAIGRAVALVARQAGAAAATFLDAHSDGHLDAGERAELRRLVETVRDSADAALAGLAAPQPLQGCA